MKLHIEQLQERPIGSGAGQHHVLWVHSSAVILHEVPVPKAPRRKWAALVPWILEEKLIQAPEDSHFVISGREAQLLDVLVIDKQQMRLWQHASAGPLFRSTNNGDD